MNVYSNKELKDIEAENKHRNERIAMTFLKLYDKNEQFASVVVW